MSNIRINDLPREMNPLEMAGIEGGDNIIERKLKHAGLKVAKFGFETFCWAASKFGSGGEKHPGPTEIAPLVGEEPEPTGQSFELENDPGLIGAGLIGVAQG